MSDTGLTDTGDLSSGIQPVYSMTGNFSAVSQLFRKSRSSEFYSGHTTKYSIRNPRSSKLPAHTVNPAGEEYAKRMTGLGEFVVDPLQAFRPEALKLNGSQPTKTGSDDSGSFNSRSLHFRARSSYRENNRNG